MFGISKLLGGPLLKLLPLNGKLRGFIIVAAWASAAAVIYATLSKLELVYRLYYLLAPLMNYPSMQTYAIIEHVAIYGVIGMLFTFVYPRSLLRVCFFLFLFIGCLEVLQTFTPDRHGTLRDAVEKMTGGAAGAILMAAALRLKRDKALSRDQGCQRQSNGGRSGPFA
jgi:VanZ family protein